MHLYVVATQKHYKKSQIEWWYLSRTNILQTAYSSVKWRTNLARASIAWLQRLQLGHQIFFHSLIERLVDSFLKLYTQMSCGHFWQLSPFFVVEARDREAFPYENDWFDLKHSSREALRDELQPSSLSDQSKYIWFLIFRETLVLRRWESETKVCLYQTSW